MTRQPPPDWLIAPHLRTEIAVREEQAAYLAHHQHRPAGHDPERGGGPLPAAGAGAMRHDPRLRAVARAIYEICFPAGEVAPLGFEQAERLDTIPYRRAMAAARAAETLHAGDDDRRTGRMAA